MSAATQITSLDAERARRALFERLPNAVDDGIEANQWRWLRFVGADNGTTWLEFQAIGVTNGRFEEARFTHVRSVADATSRLEEAEAFAATGVYVIANRIDPGVTTRERSRSSWCSAKKGASTTDADVTARMVLFVDVDAERPRGTSATDEEKAHARAVAERVVARLVQDLRLAHLAVGDSGNGYGVFVALDALPNTPEVEALIKGTLTALDLLHSTRAAHIDRAVSDAKRLVPAFGSTKRKGAPGIPERPHRRTGFLCEEKIERIGIEDLARLLSSLVEELTPEQCAEVDKAMGRKPERTAASNTANTQQGGDPFTKAKAADVRDVIAWLGLGDADGSPRCPGCGETKGTALVGNGFKCSHDRCASKGYAKGFRTTIDLVAEVRGVDAKTAVCMLADRFGFEGPRLRTQEHAAAVSAAPAPESSEPLPHTTPLGIIERWRHEGPLVRVRTGIRSLDEACRGGLPIPWRAIVVGAPSAGKTFVDTIIADTLARSLEGAGLCVGILAVDEEPDDVNVRLAQIVGFTVSECENRESDTLDQMARALEGLRVRLYDGAHTITSAAADLAAWAEGEGRRAAFFVDSIQAVRSGLPIAGNSAREIVESNVAAMRAASTAHRMLVVATSEANRASYRSEDAVEHSNDLAAGAESRAIEFGAQTQLMLRTPKDHPNVIHVRIAKNRRAFVGEFWLRLDRERHTLTECGNPESDPKVVNAKVEERRASVRADVARDAREIFKIVRANPGVGARELREEIKVAGHRWGRDRLAAAKCLASKGIDGERLVNKGDDQHDSWVVDVTNERGATDDSQ